MADGNYQKISDNFNALMGSVQNLSHFGAGG